MHPDLHMPTHSKPRQIPVWLMVVLVVLIGLNVFMVFIAQRDYEAAHARSQALQQAAASIGLARVEQALDNYERTLTGIGEVVQLYGTVGKGDDLYLHRLLISCNCQVLIGCSGIPICWLMALTTLRIRMGSGTGSAQPIRTSSICLSVTIRQLSMRIMHLGRSSGESRRTEGFQRTAGRAQFASLRGAWCMVGDKRSAKNLLSSPCWPQSFLKLPKCFKITVLPVEFLHHQDSIKRDRREPVPFLFYAVG